MDRFNKQPEETIIYTVDFSDAMATGDTLVSSPFPTSDIVNVNGTVAGDSLPVLSNLTLNNTTNQIKQKVAGGLAGQTYMYSAWVYTAAGEYLEGNFRLSIVDR